MTAPPLSPASGLSDGNGVRGRALFKKYCRQCHTLQPEGRGTGQGPNLFGFFGEPAGSRVKAWGSKSARLAERQFSWTDETVLFLLQKPTLLVPQMPGDRSCFSFRGMSAEVDRVDLLSFLKTASDV